MGDVRDIPNSDQPPTFPPVGGRTLTQYLAIYEGTFSEVGLRAHWYELSGISAAGGASAPGPQSITQAMLAVPAVGTAQLYDNCINSLKIGDGQVTDAKIASIAWPKVTGAPTTMPPSGPAGGDLAGSFYPNPLIAPNAVSDTEISSVSGTKLVNLSVTLGKLETPVQTRLPPTPVIPTDLGRVLTVDPGTGLIVWLPIVGGGGGGVGDTLWVDDPAVSMYRTVKPARGVVLEGTNTAVQWGMTAVKSRLLADSAGGSEWRSNMNVNGVMDLESQPGWRVALDYLNNEFRVGYTPPNVVAPHQFTTFLSVNGGGHVFVAAGLTLANAGLPAIVRDGTIRYANNHFQGRNPVGWVNLDESSVLGTHWIWFAAAVVGTLPPGKVGAFTDNLGLTPALHFAYTDADGGNVKSALMALPGGYTLVFTADDGSEWFRFVTNGLPTDVSGMVRIPVTLFGGLEPGDGTSLHLTLPNPVQAAGLWTDDVASSMLVPAKAGYGVALPAVGNGLVIRHSTYPTIDRRTGVDADDNLLLLHAGASGTLFKTWDSVSALAYQTQTGLWRLGDSATPTERLELVTGGIQVATALTTKAGVIQYTAGHFQGRNATAWVYLDGWTIASNLLTPTDATQTVALAPIGTALQWGMTTVKSRLLADSAGGSEWRSNMDPNGVMDVVSQPGWRVALDYLNNEFRVGYTPANAGAPHTFTTFLSANGGGHVFVAAGLTLANAGLPALVREGTVRYAGGHFQGRNAVGWVNLDEDTVLASHWIWHAAAVSGPVPSGEVGAFTDSLGLTPSLHFAYTDADGSNVKSTLMALPDGYVLVFTADDGSEWFRFVTDGLPTDVSGNVRVPVTLFGGLEPANGTSLHLTLPNLAQTAGLWTDDLANSMLVPTKTGYGVALPAMGNGLVIRHSNYPTVDRRTGVDADDNVLMLHGGASGTHWKTWDSTAVLGYLTNGGYLRLGDSTAPTERLELATGGIQVATALTTKDGVIQYTGSHFQGRIAGAWMQLDNAMGGGGSDGSLGAQNYITANATITATQLDNVITASATDITVTLPVWAASLGGQTFRFTRTDGQTARTVTVQANTGDNIDGAAFFTIACGESATIIALSAITGAKKWLTLNRYVWKSAQAGNVITPVDGTKLLVSIASGNAFEWGERTVRPRLGAARAADPVSAAYWSLNNKVPFSGNPDNSGESTWCVRMRTSDDFTIQRAPAQSGAPTFTNLWLLDSAGSSTQPGTLTIQPDPASNQARSISVYSNWGATGSGGSFVGLYKARLSGAAVQAGDDLGSLTWLGTYTPTTYRIAAQLSAQPAENHDAGGGGTNVILAVNANRSTLVGSKLTFDQAGNLTITGGTATKASGTTWANPSDDRLKKDIQPYTTGLTAILALDPILFRFNGEDGLPVDHQGLGFSAQAVLPIMPEMILTQRGRLGGYETDVLHLDTTALPLALVNAVKELTARVVALEVKS